MWQPEGHACAESDVELFFAPDGANDRYYDPVRALCAACPVRAECLQSELDVMRDGAMTFGFRGGMTAEARKRMVRINVPRPRKEVTCGTNAGRSAHVRYGERVCDPCKTAHAEYRANMRSMHVVAG